MKIRVMSITGNALGDQIITYSRNGKVCRYINLVGEHETFDEIWNNLQNEDDLIKKQKPKQERGYLE